jgi:prophage DNA circulation protein
MQGDFVIQVRPDVDLDRGLFHGRIEHVDSGQAARFQTLDEMAAFVVRHAQSKKAEDRIQKPESRSQNAEVRSRNPEL